MNTLKNLFKNLFHTFTSECPMTRNLFALIVTLFSFVISAPAFATPTEKWEVMAGQFKCGQSDEYEAGATTIPMVIADAVSGWNSCEAEYGVGNCYFVTKGYTVGPRICDYDQSHDPLDNSLADARAEALKLAFLERVPGAESSFRGNTKYVDSAYKAAALVIKPIPGATRLPTIIHTCQNELDDDGDGLTDMSDPGCTNPEDDSEFNRNEMSLFQTGIAISRLLKDASDRKCPWQITATYQIDGNVLVDIVKTDPSCTCDDEKPYATEADYVSALETELTNKPPQPSDLNNRAVMFNHYDSVRSIFTDDIGADWNESLFYDYGYIKVNKVRNDCVAEAVSQHEADYQGVNGIVMGGGTLQGSVFGDGNSISGHPWGSAYGEVGFTAGSYKSAFLMTVGAGGTFDDNCDLPSAFMAQARIGGLQNPGGRGGLVVDFRTQYSFGPSYSITPDDAATPDTNEYAVNPALGTNSLAFLLDAGAMISFGEAGGMKNGFVLLTATAGPKLRWLPDAQDQNVRHPTVTGDIGASAAIGWMF